MPDITQARDGDAPLFKPRDKPTLGERITAHIRSNGPCAIFEVANAWGRQDHLISQRFSELVEKGHLHKTGEQRIRPISNKSCDVYAFGPHPSANVTTGPATAGDEFPELVTFNKRKLARRPALDDPAVAGLGYAWPDGGNQVHYIAFITCPACSSLLSFSVVLQVRQAACTSTACGRLYKTATLDLPDGRQTLALVQDRM